LTYISEDKEFGALGHAICEENTGRVVSLNDGKLYTAKIWSIIKGKSGDPGEVVGSINYGDNTYLGDITENTVIGIYGTSVDNVYAYVDEVYMKTAYKQDVKTGPAIVRTFVSGEIKDYDIYIKDLSYAEKDRNKGITFCVTDEDLLEITNGIVQGMSGSPILQNGKVVGAVTHVLVDEPDMGYGIFIENMLEH
jgi:stage IV sporulation protein B